MQNADIQYVMEIRDLDDANDEKEEEGDGNDTKVKATFVGDDGSIMCNGQRAFGTRYDTYVTIEIPSSMERVELLAGYAPGMTEVTLTPVMTLKRKNDNQNDNGEL